MALALVPDVYTPSLDNIGKYVDINFKSDFNQYRCGVYCPCGSRKDKVYDTWSKFSVHTKTKTHNKWLGNLNLNKPNHYAECHKYRETIKNQQLIIADMDIKIQNKQQTIESLEKKLNNYPVVENLIDLY